MKSQDLVVLLKLLSIEQQERRLVRKQQLGRAWLAEAEDYLFDWHGWDDDDERPVGPQQDPYSVRALEAALGISKTEVSQCLKRSLAVGLIAYPHRSQAPRVNKKVLLGILSHAVKYVFPAHAGAIMRGIPTAFAAPVLQGELMSAGELIPVWPDPHGRSKGEALDPLFKSVPFAVRKDPRLYEYLALVDAVRSGGPREAKVATERLSTRILQP